MTRLVPPHRPVIVPGQCSVCRHTCRRPARLYLFGWACAPAANHIAAARSSHR